MKKALTILMILFKMNIYANNVNINFFDKKLNQNLIFQKVQQVISQDLEQRHKLKDVLDIKIMPIYNTENLEMVDYYFVFLTSTKTYSFSVNQVFLSNDKISKIIENYAFTKKDLEKISAKYSEYNPQCPDENIDFVVTSPAFSQVPSAGYVINNIYDLAIKNKFKTVKLIDKQSTVEAYLDYLSCKNLKGFFNISHGLPDSIMLDNGLLDYTLINKHLKNKLLGVTVLFNSCCMFGGDDPACIRKDHPLKDSIVNIAKAQKFIGSYNPLEILLSENVSKCFWHRAFSGAPLDDGSLDVCKFYSPTDIFRIEGIGKNYLLLPKN